MQGDITGPEQPGPQPAPGVMKVLLRRLAFVVFGGPLILMGLLFGAMAVAEGMALVVLVCVLWIATGVVLGRHAASGFAVRSLFTAGIAVLATAVTMPVVTHLQDQGHRSLAELLGGAYIFCFLLWAVVALPVATARGLRRLLKRTPKHAQIES